MIRKYPGSLHNHTDYSNLRLRDSINKVEDLLNYADELGQEVIAITEHETISNSIKVEEAYNKLKKKGSKLKVILGNEIYLCRDGLNKDNFIKSQDKYYHFILLAKNKEGHKQIRQLSSRAWKRSYMVGKMRRVPTYYSDLEEIIGKNKGNVIGSSACFKKGTQVETKNGWKNIEEISSGDFVINRYGEWEEVIEPTSMITHQYGYNIELTGNERPIICTDNHEFLVITNKSKKPRWIQAKNLNLKRGESKHIGLEPVGFLYSQSNIINKKEWNDSYIKKSKYSHRRITLPEKILVTPELMRLFGLFLGDGCISLKKNPNISFTFNEKEYDNYMDSFIKKASEQLNITWTIIRRPEHHRVDISSSSRDLINLFYYLFGDVKATNKRVPDRLRISKELDYELVFGYLLADGYFRTRTNSGKVSGYLCGEFSSASVSKELSYDIYHILNQLNITSSITKVKGKTDKNGVVHKDAWYVHGSNKILGSVDKTRNYSAEDVIDLFEKSIQVKEKDFISIDNIRYRKIRFKKATKIELNERVYCLNNSTHSFKCENLIVHNCLGGALPTQLLKYRENQDPELYEAIIQWCYRMINIFGEGNFFLEMQPSNNKDQIYVNKELLKLSKMLNIPYIITTDSHYLKKEEASIHEAYLKSQEGDREVKEFYETTYLMGTEELESFFDYFSEEELEKAYDNILSIKDMCVDYSLFKPLRIPELSWKTPKTKIISDFYFEKMPMLKTFINSSYEGDNILAKIIVDKIIEDETLQNEQTYFEINDNLRITWESSEKNHAHWSAYFLNLQGIIDTCWDSGSLVMPGRGSGVGFILLYVLGITQINPLREKTKTYSWRFLNPERVSVLDVDFDISGLKRNQVLKGFRKKYGEDRIANVVTFGTEKSKSAILTAARGLGIDVDIAQGISALVPSDRGMIRSLDQCMYGDKANGFKPIPEFVKVMTKDYPELWEIAHRIEGLICRMGIHAGGVIFVDEDFEKSTALMRAPDGTIVTQFELHDAEKVSLIKYDALSVEAADRIQTCLELLIKYGYVKKESTLKETYEKILGVYNIERDDPKMWKMVWNHEILNLFQMEQQSGIQGIELTRPKSVDDLATLNSIIRLMAQEKGSETPLEKYAKFKNNISLWYKEMEEYGLTEKEQKLLIPILETSYGICESQERFMTLVQLPECGGFDLNWADRLRKSIAKKDPSGYMKLEEEYFKNMKEKHLSENLCNYVWKVLIATSRGYGFNLSHTLAYSILALQEMNLAYKFPIIFWNTACLMVDSGALEEEEENSDEEFDEESKKTKGVNYGKIAKALGKTLQAGINIAPPNINTASKEFKPDVDHNRILYSLKAISGVGDKEIEIILDNRPFNSFDDFLNRAKMKKTSVISLIKSGAFDELENKDRIEIMKEYISIISEPKSKLNLQNFKGLIDRDMIPENLDFYRRLFNFNKYIRQKQFKTPTELFLDEIAQNFMRKNYQEIYEECTLKDNNFIAANEKRWKKVYDKEMDTARNWLKNNQEELLNEYNKKLFNEQWKKYCLGTISKWEMDSMSYYWHDHELEHIQERRYGVSNFSELPEEPMIDKIYNFNGREVPTYKITKIVGTCIDKNNTKGTFTLLTPDGEVVDIRLSNEHYALYNKQISEVQPDGSKKVKEKSWFSRGNKLMVVGFRRGSNFVPKKYKSTPEKHRLFLITDVNEKGEMLFTSARYGAEE